MRYEIKETVTTKDGLYYKKTIQEIPVASESENVKKGLARKRIQDEVFDLPDSIADNAKMISLMMSVIKRIYEALPTTTKNKIKDKEMIEEMIKVFDNIQTLADVQFAQEGDKMIKKIFDRQAKIGDIIKDVYNVSN